MKKIKKILKKTVTFAVMVCLLLVVGLMVCGLPLGDIKKSLQSKLKNK